MFVGGLTGVQWVVVSFVPLAALVSRPVSDTKSLAWVLQRGAGCHGADHPPADVAAEPPPIRKVGSMQHAAHNTRAAISRRAPSPGPARRGRADHAPTTLSHHPCNTAAAPSWSPLRA